MKALRIFSVALFVSMLPAAVLAGTAAETVQVEGAYVRAVPPGQPNTAAFMSLTNTDDSDHAVIAAHSDAAEAVELHTHMHDNGVMRMRKIERIEIGAGAMQVLEPGGLHIMLIGLQEPLQPDDTVTLTLEFDDGSSVDVQAPVRPIEGMTHEHHHMQHQ